MSEMVKDNIYELLCNMNDDEIHERLKVISKRVHDNATVFDENVPFNPLYNAEQYCKLVEMFAVERGWEVYDMIGFYHRCAGATLLYCITEQAFPRESRGDFSIRKAGCLAILVGHDHSLLDDLAIPSLDDVAPSAAFRDVRPLTLHRYDIVDNALHQRHISAYERVIGLSDTDIIKYLSEIEGLTHDNDAPHTVMTERHGNHAAVFNPLENATQYCDLIKKHWVERSNDTHNSDIVHQTTPIDAAGFHHYSHNGTNPICISEIPIKGETRGIFSMKKAGCLAIILNNSNAFR